MNIIRIILFITLGLFVATLVGSLVGLTGNDRIFLAVLSFIALLMALPAFKMIRVAQRHAFFHIVASGCIAVFYSASVALLYWAKDDWSVVLQSFGIIITGVTFISLLIGVPIFLTPLLQSQRMAKTRSTTSKGFVLDQRLRAIKSSFGDFHDKLVKQQSSLDSALDELQENLQSEVKKLDKIQDELTAAKSEVDYYKRISKLSKNDQKAFLDLITRNRRSEYLIGLLLGLTSSSSIVTLAVWLISKFR